MGWLERTSARIFCAKNDPDEIVAWAEARKDYPAMVAAIGPIVRGQTYAGPGGSGDAYVPDTFYGVVMSGQFYFHDGRFEIGGGQAEFDEANDKVIEECDEWLDSKDWWPWGFNTVLRRRAKKRARIYYLAVSKGGAKYFNWEDKRYCKD